jgi:hypothetical protein
VLLGPISKTYRLPIRSALREIKVMLKVSSFNVSKNKTQQLQPKQCHHRVGQDTSTLLVWFVAGEARARAVVVA